MNEWDRTINSAGSVAMAACLLAREAGPLPAHDAIQCWAFLNGMQIIHLGDSAVRVDPLTTAVFASIVWNERWSEWSVHLRFWRNPEAVAADIPWERCEIVVKTEADLAYTGPIQDEDQLLA